MSVNLTVPAYTFPDNSIQYTASPYIQSGVYAANSFFNGSPIGRTFTFPVAFSSPPVVTITLLCNSVIGNNAGGPTYWITNITNTNFTFYYVLSSNNTWPNPAIGEWCWIAIGQPK